MKRWLASLVFVLMAVALVFTASCAAGEGEAKTYKLGMLGPLTGPAAPWFLTVEQGAEIAVAEVNEAGGIVVGGETYMLQIVARDDKVYPEESVTAVQKMIFDDKLQYIYGPIGDSCCLAVRPITEENHVVTFSYTYASEEFPLGPDYPYSFTWLDSMCGWNEIGYDWLKENYPEVERVAIIAPAGGSGERMAECTADMAQARGIEVVSTQFFESGTMDFSPQITRMLAGDPDLIDTTVSGSSGSALMTKQARGMGYDGLLWSCARPNWKVMALAAGLENAEGFIAGGYPEYPKGTPEQKAFHQKFVDRFGEDLWDNSAGEGYDWIYMMAAVFQEVDSFDVDVVVAALEGGEFDILKGVCRFGGEEQWGIAHERFSGRFDITVFHDGEWEPVVAIEY